MGILEFLVCRHRRHAQWIVKLGRTIYGSYLDKSRRFLMPLTRRVMRGNWAGRQKYGFANGAKLPASTDEDAVFGAKTRRTYGYRRAFPFRSSPTKALGFLQMEFISALYQFRLRSYAARPKMEKGSPTPTPLSLIFLLFPSKLCGRTNWMGVQIS